MNDSGSPNRRLAIRIADFLLATLFVAVSMPVIAAPKTDIVIFKNGDKLTGEFKSLQRGQLNLNTDATGTIGIEWNKIANVISAQDVQVETSSGARYFGHLAGSDKSGRVVVETTDGPQMLDSARVVLMTPIEKVGFGAFDIDVSLGYNFAKAGGVTQATAGVNLDYRTQKRIYSATASTTTNDSDTQFPSDRKNLGLAYKRLWQNRWYVYGSFSMDQNDELDLNLRTSIGGGGGQFLIQSNTMLLGLEAGLQFSREDNVNEPVDVDSIELVLALDWDWFRFDHPELDWSTQLEVIPNLSEWGRIRLAFDTGLSWEIFNDLDWGVTFYSSFDNQPNSPDGSVSDFGVNTELTYEF